jgi:hypothetical protein
LLSTVGGSLLGMIEQRCYLAVQTFPAPLADPAENWHGLAEPDARFHVSPMAADTIEKPSAIGVGEDGLDRTQAVQAGEHSFIPFFEQVDGGEMKTIITSSGFQGNVEFVVARVA